MRKHHILPNSAAVSELVGSMILIIIAILAFSAIYAYVFPLPSLNADTHVKIDGYVDSNGFIVLEHAGGESLSSYRIDLKDENGLLIYSDVYTDDEWSIGERKLPNSTRLSSESEIVQVTVVMTDREGQETVFDGILTGCTVSSPSMFNSSDPYLISSLLSDTSDEDLICFNKTRNGETINASFDADNYVYNWILDGNPIASLLYSMDKNNATNVNDYSGNAYHATVHGATWNSNGLIGGSYDLDGDDYISVPYCFDDSSISQLTVEAWIKTGNESVAVLSFNRSSYFDLSVLAGSAKWTVSSAAGTVELQSTGLINDSSWHLLSATYDSTNGISEIYIDGMLNASISGFNPGVHLGDHTEPIGYIGKSINPNSVEETVILVDDFETDKGWTVDYTYWWMNGIWERGIPVNDGRGDPPSDYDGSGNCYITENEREEDIDYGTTYLISPTMDMSTYDEVEARYAVWYTNDYGNDPNDDIFVVSISNDGGNSWVTADTIGPQTPLPRQWIEYSLNISDHISLTSSMKIRFEASDLDSGSVVEAGVDAVNITGISHIQIENFTGFIDEISLYPIKLSEEQIYQNYLCKKSGSSLSVMVSEETVVGDLWSCQVTPVNETTDAEMLSSDVLTIINYGGG